MSFKRVYVREVATIDSPNKRSTITLRLSNGVARDPGSFEILTISFRNEKEKIVKRNVLKSSVIFNGIMFKKEKETSRYLYENCFILFS